jgi:hypothetical protein
MYRYEIVSLTQFTTQKLCDNFQILIIRVKFSHNIMSTKFFFSVIWKLPGLDAVVIVSVPMFFDRDLQSDGEVSHEDDSDWKKQNGDREVDPE